MGEFDPSVLFRTVWVISESKSASRVAGSRGLMSPKLHLSRFVGSAVLWVHPEEDSLGDHVTGLLTSTLYSSGELRTFVPWAFQQEFQGLL